MLNALAYNAPEGNCFGEIHPFTEVLSYKEEVRVNP
jgi:hypothetical protein